jgi:uncharacterized damage-inducible protein DinB
MQCYSSQDLARSFRTVRNNTIQIAEEIPEEHYGFRAAPESRSVAETLAHIAAAPRWSRSMHTKRITHPDFAAFRAGHEELMKYQATLTTKAQILEALRTGGEEFASWLATLSDEMLGERVYFPEGAQPASKTRFEMLLSPKEHEMHHRAQLMVVERMVGIVPHLTREQQERAAAMERQPASARAGTA